MRKALKVISVLSILVLFGTLVFGQTNTGQVQGTIRDTSGAALAGAKVTVKSVSTGLTRTTTTNSVGLYTIAGLRPDTYDVVVEASGFQKMTRRAEVPVGGVAEVSADLAVTGGEVMVEVTGTNEAVQVNTESQTLSTVITNKQVTELPTLTRNPYDLVGTAGNVAEDSTSGRGAGYAINGQRSASTDILLDGGENVDLFTATVGQQVPLDSVQEFSVMTNNFTAEYGRAGGGVVNVVTKSGTNSFKGTLYEFNRVSALAANTYNNDATGTPKGLFTRNQFGYSIGGPVIKNKLFFFSSTEWIRVRSNADQFFEITDPSFLQYTSASTQQFFNAYGSTRPLTVHSVIPFSDSGLACGGEGIPCNAALADVVSYKTPINAGGGSPQNTWESVARVDFNWTDKTTIFGRYAVYKTNLFDGVINNSPYSGYDTGETDLNQNYTFNITHVFSPTLVNSTKVVYNRLTQQQPLGAAPLTPGLFVDAAVDAISGNYQYVFPGYVQTSTANALPFGGPQNLYQVYDDVSWTKGKHQFKFGGQYVHTRDNRVFGAYENAVQILGNNSVADGIQHLIDGNVFQFEAAVDPQGAFPCSKNALGKYTVTSDCTFNLPGTSPSFARNFRYHDMAFYAQDSWKFTPRFTINLGLRWEYYGVQHNSDPNLDSNFYLGSGSTIFDQIRNGSVQKTHDSTVGGFWNPAYKNFAPRVGFAWDVFGDGKTSLRGGYGISYERNFGNVTYNVIQNPPNYAVVSIFEGTDVPSQPIYTANLGAFATAGSTCAPLATGTTGPAEGTSCLPNVTLRAPDQNIRTAYTQSWNFSAERQVGKSSMVSAEYVGAKGTHLYDIANINVPYMGSTYLGDARLSNRINYQYGNINYRGSNAYSSYNGLNLGFKSNNLWNKGLTLTANYTWSHSLDNLSSTFSDGYWGNYWLGYTDAFHPNLDYGNSDFDIRHRFVISTIWEMPWFKNSSSAVARQVLGGWSISPVIKVLAGSPYTIFDGSNGYTIYPRWAPGGSFPRSASGSPVATGPNEFTYMNLPTTDVNCPYSATCAIGTGNALQVPSTRDVFCVAPGTGGNPFTCNGGPMIGRNAFTGPGYWNWDMVLGKTIKLSERFSMQFRGELYDVTNHHNYYINSNLLDIEGGATSIQAVKGGNGSSNDERRNVQFGLKLLF